MYSVLLDQDNYFTGNYAKVGNIEGGISIESIPPEINSKLQKYWKYDYHDVTKIVKMPTIQIVKTNAIDDVTGEEILDDEGNPKVIETPVEVIEDQEVTVSVLEWFFDDIKYNEQELLALKQEKIEFINSYKHEARLYFPYGSVGGVQRFGDEDINFINLTIAGFESGNITEVYWKYSNNQYDKVTSVEYFTNMLLKGGQLINKAFSTELQVVTEINSITSLSDLINYDQKSRFDELFNQE